MAVIGSVTWQPGRYLAFASERLRPAIDLLSRVPLDTPSRIADLGCGPGNSTALLRQRWPDAEILGVDSSSDMLAEALRTGPDATWLQADLVAWQPDGAFDLIFSNATLHWLDHHDRLLPRLVDALTPGGCLAVQMPNNFHEPSHRSVAEIAAKSPWAEALVGTLRKDPVSEPARYYDLLAPLCATLELWETVYHQVLAGEDPVLNWLRGTTLRPVLSRLDEADQATFETALAERLRRSYPPLADGRTLFPFRRLFMVALAKD